MGGNRRVPAGARRAIDPCLQLSLSDLRQQLRLHQPESRWEFRDTYAINAGTHSVKFGGEYNYMPYVSEGAGNSPQSGTYTFNRDQYSDPNDPASVAALTGAATFSASTPYTTSHPTKCYVGFVQDDWRVAPNVTVNLGLRYERLYGNANEDLDVNSFPVTLPYVDVPQSFQGIE